MRNKGISLLIPVLFLGMLLLVGAALTGQDTGLSQVTFQDPEHSLTLMPYFDEASGQYFLYLPSFTDPEALTLSTPWYMRAETQPAASDGQALTVSAGCLWGKAQSYTLSLMRCSARQTISIEAKEGLQEHLHSDQTHESQIYITFRNQSGETEHAGGATISGRGNGTWGWPKKPYDLEFSDPVTVGPFHQTDKLCLLAEYTDFSKLRNALGHYAGQLLHIPYASPYVYADVYINGVYQGLYGMASKQDFRQHTDADGIQAVFELTSSGKGNLFYTGMGKAIRTRSGDASLAYDRVAALEQALLAQDWDALAQVIDLSSWAEKYALEELLYNYDMSLTSQYFYIGQDNKIRCMLPWDYEWILYARLYPFEGPDSALSAYWNRTNWFEHLLENPAFRQEFLTALEGFESQALIETLCAYLADCESETSGSWRCDLTRWNTAYRQTNTVSPDAVSQAEYRQQFRDYLTARLDFLRTLFRDWEGYCLVSFESGFDGIQAPAKLQLILPKGADFQTYHDRIEKSIATPEGYEFLGWFAEDGTPLAEITTVAGDMTLTGHYRSAANGDTP